MPVALAAIDFETTGTAAAAELRKLPGVAGVVPRIVGRIELGRDRVSAVLVGVPVKDFPAGLECVRGRLYGSSSRNEPAAAGRLGWSASAARLAQPR